MLQKISRAVIVEIHAKNTDSFNKTFFYVKMKPPNMKEILLKLQLISW